jgi:hypothetical protein
VWGLCGPPARRRSGLDCERRILVLLKETVLLMLKTTTLRWIWTLLSLV